MPTWSWFAYGISYIYMYIYTYKSLISMKIIVKLAAQHRVHLIEVEGPRHCSDGRPTPVLYEKTFDFQSRGLPQEAQEAPKLLLRQRLARSVLDYELMKEEDSPVRGIRGLQSLRAKEAKEEKVQAASKIQARYRGQRAQKERP